MTACPECLRSTPCKKCAAGIACIQPDICDEPECWVCDDDEPDPEGCPDCSEHSRCPACADDFLYHHDKDNE